jgi:hypothetical protein
LQDATTSGLQAQNDRGVDHILAGRAGVHVARGFLGSGADLFGELLCEGNRECPLAAFARERCCIEFRGLADAGDDFRMRGRHKTVLRGGARQGAFEARHRREQLFVGQQAGADLVGEQEI